MTARLAELLDALDPHISRVEVFGTDKGTTARVSVFVEDTATTVDLGALLAVEDPFGNASHALERALGEAAIWVAAKGAKIDVRGTRVPEIASNVIAGLISDGIVRRTNDGGLEIDAAVGSRRKTLSLVIDLLVELGAVTRETPP